MGASKYVQEVWRKKQSDVMKYLLRVRCWSYRQMPAVQRVSRPSRPERAHRLGYKAKQGFVIYRVRVRRGSRKRPVKKGITYGKPVTHGVRERKTKQSLQAIAEGRAGRRCNALRVLNSYWVCEDGTYRIFEVIMVDPAHKVIRDDPAINWICNPNKKHRELHGLTSASKKSRGIGKGHSFHQTIGGSQHAAWRRRNTVRFARVR
ncbi:60S ribosomal protein L15-like [Octopus sinensis]|uniref:Ribosomal protein L15 n=1 Tax=Octopus sinensis TaxID=2607531 RepID=A0A7E6EIC4_9MOLL|nr:60S ribosomal protein L15-like [Octopus sinensis]